MISGFGGERNLVTPKTKHDKKSRQLSFGAGPQIPLHHNVEPSRLQRRVKGFRDIVILFFARTRREFTFAV
jgi:hypothetical protein